MSPPLERLERAEHTEHAAYVEHTERSAPTEQTAHIEGIEHAEYAEYTERAAHIERTEHSAPTKPSAHTECAAHTAHTAPTEPTEPTDPTDPTDPAPLLHNMSAPPKTVVTYTGLSGLAKQSGPGGSGTSAVAVRGADVFGLPLCFALPAAFTADTPEAVLAEVYAQAQSREAGDMHDRAVLPIDTTLERLIDARAAELPLPDGCLVVPADDTHAMPWPDLLAALAVLAKCSDTVWLRAKTPSLTAALARRRASLLVPPRFAQALGVAGMPPMPTG